MNMSDSGEAIRMDDAGAGIAASEVHLGDVDDGDSDSSSSTSFVRMSLHLMIETSRPVARRAGELLEEGRVQFVREVWPVVVREFTVWKEGLLLELEHYEARGNSRARLVLTVIAVFVIAFHVELIQAWKHLAQRGGAFERWKHHWTLYYELKQRQWRRKQQLKLRQQAKKSKKDNRRSTKNSMGKNMASPTSTASTVEAESNMTPFSRPLSPTHGSNDNRRMMLMLQRQQNKSPLSPKLPSASAERPAKGVRESYRNRAMEKLHVPQPWQLQYNSQSNRNFSNSQTSIRTPISARSQSMGHGSSRSNQSGSARSQNSYHIHQLHHNGHGNALGDMPDTTSSLLDSTESFDILATNKASLNISKLTQTSSLASGTGSPTPQYHSSISVASSTNNTATHSHTTTTPSDSTSYVTPQPGGDDSSNSRSKPVNVARVQKLTRKMKKRNQSQNKLHHSPQSPPEAAPPQPSQAPLRRHHTLDSSPTNQTNKLRFKKKPAASGAPLAQARRRMSTGGATAAMAAAAANQKPVQMGLQRTRTGGSVSMSSSSARSRNHPAAAEAGTHYARQMHPRTRSGTGATTTTASQMYMARHPSGRTGANSPTPTSKHSPGRGVEMHPGSRSPRSTSAQPRAHSPMRSPPSSSSPYRSTSGQGMLSRQELGYE